MSHNAERLRARAQRTRFFTRLRCERSHVFASPETMLAPGVPSAAVADALTRGGDWAKDVVDATMRQRYGPTGSSYHPAAAFDVFDLAPQKIARAREAVRAFDDAAAELPHESAGVRALKADVRGIRGMVRFDHSADMPWHADRPAEAMYDAIAGDDRLPAPLRAAAGNAAAAVRDLVLAHRESSDFGPFNASYTDAAGPTVHAPLARRSFDTWADRGVTETHNPFYDEVDGREFARAVGGYNAAQDRAGDALG